MATGLPAPAPYLPFLARPAELELTTVDLLVRRPVKRINESGWVWTAESCQGHPDRPAYPQPYLRLITCTANLGRLLALIVRAGALATPHNHTTVMLTEDFLTAEYAGIRVTLERAGEVKAFTQLSRLVRQ